MNVARRSPVGTLTVSQTKWYFNLIRIFSCEQHSAKSTQSANLTSTRERCVASVSLEQGCGFYSETRGNFEGSKKAALHSRSS